MSEENKYASSEQILFAKIMGTSVKIGFITLVITFVLYMSGAMTTLVPVDQISHYWGLSAAEYAKATGTPTGWGWVKDVAKVDILNYVGIVMLASASIFSTLAVLPQFARQGEKAHLGIAALLIVVLLVSASNILH